jgi:Tfp pilus assembly protein PilX
MQLEQMKQDREDQRKKAELDARMAMNMQDNQTAMQLAAAEIASGERFDVSTGTGINPQP